MDTFDCIATKLDVRRFGTRTVPGEVKLAVLEAGRLTGSGVNLQHWRFILVREGAHLRQLSANSTSGRWIENANFAVILLTDPQYGFHKLDAGRAVQDMQLAAWNQGVVSCIFTGVKKEALRRDFNIPRQFDISVVAGFGYPAGRVTGRKKKRRSLREVAFLERYGNPLDPEAL